MSSGSPHWDFGELGAYSEVPRSPRGLTAAGRLLPWRGPGRWRDVVQLTRGGQYPSVRARPQAGSPDARSRRFAPRSNWKAIVGLLVVVVVLRWLYPPRQLAEQPAASVEAVYRPAGSCHDGLMRQRTDVDNGGLDVGSASRGQRDIQDSVIVQGWPSVIRLVLLAWKLTMSFGSVNTLRFVRNLYGIKIGGPAYFDRKSPNCCRPGFPICNKRKQ